MCECVSVCVELVWHTHVFAHIYCVCMYICVCKHVCMCLCMCVYECVCVSVCVCAQNMHWLNCVDGNKIRKNKILRLYLFKISDQQTLKILIVCIFLTSDHHTFLSLFKVGWHVIGCIVHDNIVVVCSKLFMRLSYYVHQRYGKKLTRI